MSIWFSALTSGRGVTPHLPRRYFSLQLATGALLAGTPQLGSKWAFAADVNAEIAGGVYARLRAAGLIVLVNGQKKASGALIDPGGLAVTAAHVIGQKGARVGVLLNTDERLAAEVVAVDLGHDLALLRLPGRAGGYPFLPVAARTPNPAATVFCLGTPPTMRIPVLLRGSMASDQLVYAFLGVDFIPSLTVSAHLPLGTSGGPWVNDQGEVFGVQSGVVSQHGISVGVALVSPVSGVRRLLEMRRNAVTPHVGMGVADILEQEQPHRALYPVDAEGLFVTSVAANGPAARAGVKQWSLIFGAEAQPIRTITEFFTLMRVKKPGDEFLMEVLEPGGATKREVKVALGLLEASWQ